MLSQELGVRLKAMPPEAMLEKFPDLVREPKSSQLAGWLRGDEW
jgi:hypothetical protein